MNVIIVSVGACVISQLIKVLIVLAQKKRLDLRAFINTGGMPSSHSVIVGALATSVAIVEGLGSVAFGISAVLAFVVMFDAAGLRRSVGKQAVILNLILRELQQQHSINDVDLHESIGHTLLQVIAGALIGAAVSFLWFTLFA